jgi:hypothetical protein
MVRCKKPVFQGLAAGRRSGLPVRPGSARRGITEKRLHYFKALQATWPVVPKPLKSILCQEDPYLRELVGYIHLNPFTVGLVEDISGLDRYAFSGHSALMGHKDRPWQDTNYILKVVFRGKIDRSQTLLAILLYADGAISNTER